MKHQLDRHLRRVHGVSLTPIVAYRVCKDRSRPVESSRTNSATHLRIALQTVLGIAVPEVKSAVTAGCAEGAVLWVERDGVHGVNVSDITGVGRVLAVTFE